MGFLRFYKKFYCVSTAGTSDTYTLITPTSVTASAYIAGTGGTESSTVIQNNVIVVEEETGIFYANLDATLYASDVTYDLVFFVQYTPEAPLNKKLSVRFRVKAYNIAGVIDYELGDITSVVVEILDNNDNVIEVQVQGNGIDLDISSKEVEQYINNSNNNDNGSVDIEIN